MSHFTWKNLKPFELHQKLINEYLSATNKSRSNVKTDFDVIRENHKFLWDEKDEKNVNTWEKRLAKKYYDKLYREYSIADLSRYKENKFGLRWRTEEELINGRGQFSCGNKKCREEEKLRTWEVNFAYLEEGEKKNALVKLRLCPRCSYKLNYTHKKLEVKRQKKKRRDKDKNKTTNKTATCSKEDKSDDNNKDEAPCKPNESELNMEVNEGDIWKSKGDVGEEKSREEEFEEYLEELFL